MWKPSLKAESTFRFLETRAKIRGFADLRPGWHYGEGVPASPQIVAAAEKVLDGLVRAGLLKTNAFPGIEGAIMVTAYDDEKYYEFQIDAGGEVTYAFEVGRREVVFREGLTLEQALEIICEIERHYPWALSGFSTTATMTPTAGTSKAWRSKIQAMEAAYQLLTKTVPAVLAVIYARTLAGTTLSKQTPPPSSGAYRTPRYRLVTESYKRPPQPATPATTTFRDFPEALLEESSNPQEPKIYEYA